MNIIFLDIDGVLNCQVFYEKIKNTSEPQQEIDPERVSWLNDLCKECDAKVVISAGARIGRSIEELIDKFKKAGATFEIIGKTPNLRAHGGLRGNEIYNWIESNTNLIGRRQPDFYTYVIIDDDSDMLLWQKDNFFHVDGYGGLTPNTCYKIKRFFNKFKLS